MIIHQVKNKELFINGGEWQDKLTRAILESRGGRILTEKMEMIGEDKGGLYLFDRDIINYRGVKK